ncbi:response regulator [Waterburya agarophytonicola K14]|uniref:Response regulator n=1 Tax=Waterburya agarophytonicola KI4 TaxID=2874699 RepID=A0A964FF15_9CYAN|nr:response regulator [Waterburya agarophytonicola]MCC0176456.1 response regulator [Waterburya agarophytonicola KI4]
MIRILIVDDQKVIREKLRYMVQQYSDMEVVGIATEGNSALEQVELLNPDIILIDIEMPNMDGIAATKIISSKFSQTKVLVLSSFDSQEYVAKSLDAGAKGYLLKSLSAEELHNSIKFIHQGYSQILGPGLLREMATVGSPVASSSVISKSHAAASNGSNYKGIEAIGFDDSEQGIITSNGNNGSELSGQSSAKSKFRWKFWLSSWAVLNLAVWTLALLSLKFKIPTYVSEWSLVLPGEEKVDFKIPNIGEALARNNSAVEDIDPRNNILYLASSKSVILNAADSMEMSSSEFGEPDIELVDGSAIISFKIIGDSPEQAQAKAKALHQSILQTIKSFRVDKTNQRTESASETVEADRAKLTKLQQQLNDHTVSSDLVSPEQIQVLIGRIESLRDQKKSISRDLAGFDQEIASLSGNLGLSPQQAEDLLALQGDSIFQQHLQQYNQITGNLALLQSRFTANAPQVVDERLKQQDIETALFDRGRWVIDKPIDRQMLKKLSLQDNTGQKDVESMAKSLLSASNSQQILAKKEQALDRQISELDARIKKLNQEKIPFENLQREIQFAEALLTSKAAGLDIAGDSSPAFPDIQILSSPSLPDKRNPDDIRKPLIGALALTFLSTTGLMLFAWDKKNAFKF